MANDIDDLREKDGFQLAARNKTSEDWNVTYDAEKAGLDDAQGRWVTVCEAHEQHKAFTDKAAAYAALHNETDWCEQCRAQKQQK